MNISTILITILALLILLYSILKRQYKKTPLVRLESFGPKATKKQHEIIIAQRIRQQSISFWAYIISLGLTFGFGFLLAAHFYAEPDVDLSKIAEGLGLCGGATTTFGFKQLHNKCGRDLQDV